MADEPDDATSTTPGGDQPSAPEIRAQLDKILASRCFEQAQRASRFLRYAVEQTLAGHGERLKGYTIAVEAFDRSPDFDAQSDPLVRVEAGRLRRRLIEYYATEGQDDAVRIELPRGAYSVAWTLRRDDRNAALGPALTADTLTAGPAGHVRRRRRWRRIRTLILAGVILIAFAIIVLQQREFSRLTPARYPTFAEVLAQGRAPVVVLPFEDLTGDARSRTLAQTLTEEVLVQLDEHDLFAVAAEPRGDIEPDTGGLATGYVLSGSVRYTPDAIRITARLVLGGGARNYGATLTTCRSRSRGRRPSRQASRARSRAWPRLMAPCSRPSAPAPPRCLASASAPPNAWSSTTRIAAISSPRCTPRPSIASSV